MAHKKYTESADGGSQKDSEGQSGNQYRDKLLLIRRRYKIMVEADQENRRNAMEDLKFLRKPGEQWDYKTKKRRGNRPCYEFNKLGVKADRIINDMRANRPSGKVRPTEDGDKETADTIEGLARNIFAACHSDTVFDYAGEYQVGAGMGAWRIDTEYVDESFDQDILIEPIKNPFCLYCDPAAKDPLKRDADDWILTECIPNAVFDERYGKKAKKVDFDDAEFDDDEDWRDEETTRVVEYHYTERSEKELWLLKDGKVVDSTAPEAALIDPSTIVKKRMTKCACRMMCVASGDALLEEPVLIAGRHHRFVMVYGKWLVIDGKTIWYGLTRNAKDAQRRYNVSQTAVTETVATAPQSKFWATPKQAEGHLDKWNVAHEENLPFLMANSDPAMPGFPQRMGGADIPAALIQEAAMADQDLKDVTGVYDANIGARSNETSGRAITRRAEQSDLINFQYRDNMAKAIERTWEIVVDLIPHIYDTERSIRVLGLDGAEKYVRINSFVVDPATGEQKAVNDLRRGKFDVTITSGPSFTTQRQEAAESYTQLAQSFPPLMQVAGDLVFKSMDLPYAEQIADRLRAMLPPQIQQQLSEGKQIPPEAQAVMAQAQQATQLVQQQTQLVQAAAQEVEQSKAESEKARAQVQTELAKLDTKKAQLEAYVAEQMAKIAQAEAQIAQQGATAGNEQERAGLQAQLAEAIAGIQQIAAQFMAQAAQTIADMQARSQPQVVVASPPKRRQVRVRRENGELIGEVQEIADVIA